MEKAFIDTCVGYKEFRKALEARQGVELTQRLESTRVAIAGLGGLGSLIAILLARCGVGNLHIIDFDRVELSNIHRQQYRLCQIGRQKTDALEALITEVNPFVKVEKDCRRVTLDNATEVFNKDYIICEAFDNPEEKAMLAQVVTENHPEKILISASGLAGYKSGNLIRTRKAWKNFYIAGDMETDIEDGIGLMAPRAAICAAHQANMVVRIVAGEMEP